MTDTIKRAAEADRLWNDDLMAEARAHIKQTIVDKWMASPMDDIDGREKLRYLLHVHECYDRFFRRAIEDGRMAQLEEERKKKGLREYLRIA